MSGEGIGYTMLLDELNETHAIFRHPNHSAVFLMPRDNWESMERPGTIDAQTEVRS